MRAHHRHLHAFGGFEGVFGPLSAATIGHPLGWNPAFCAFAFRVLPFESVSSRPDGSISCSSRPYGSFSCRFCGFQEGAFSMASYRSFRGSKGTLGPCRAVCLWRVGLEFCWGSAVSHPYGSFSCRFCGFQEGAFSMASYRSFRGSKGTLGPCRAVCLWRVGLESCWGSAVSHACPPPVPPCFWRFRRRVWAPVCRHNWTPLGLESCFRFSSPPVWKCFQPSGRELFVPILWLPRRCVFDGFLQEF